MILSRRALIATALTLPLSARAQTPARGPLVFDLKPGKLTTVAGFELGTGVLINIVNPEQAAEELAAPEPVAETG